MLLTSIPIFKTRPTCCFVFKKQKKKKSRRVFNDKVNIDPWQYKEFSQKQEHWPNDDVLHQWNFFDQLNDWYRSNHSPKYITEDDIEKGCVKGMSQVQQFTWKKCLTTPNIASHSCNENCTYIFCVLYKKKNKKTKRRKRNHRDHEHVNIYKCVRLTG